MLRTLFSIRSLLISLSLSIPLLISCGGDGDAFLKERTQVLVILSGDGSHRGIAVYDLEGNLLSETDLKDEVTTGYGIAPYDDDSFLVSTNGSDAIYRVFFTGEKELFYGSNQLNGAVYAIAQGPLGHYYVAESNRIEVFDINGTRLTNLYIANSDIPGCTLSTNLRHFFINPSGHLIVTDRGNNSIHTIDINTEVPNCLSSVAYPNTPYGSILHSNGQLYTTSIGNDLVYTSDPDGSNRTEAYNPNDLTILRDPTAIVELPNGNILVASSVTDSIEQITPDGVRVGSTAFIRDSQSLNVTDMRVLYWNR